MNEKSEPKLHHYIPQFELSYFTENELLWIYDRKTNTYRQQNVKNTAAISNFYTYTLETGEKNKNLEKALSISEGISAPILKKIQDGHWKQNPQERSEFAAYLALKWLRVPIQQKKTEALVETLIKLDNKKLASNPERFNKILDEVEKKEGLESIDRDELAKFMQDDTRYFVNVQKEWGLQGLIMNLREIGEEIYRMSWSFCYAPKGKSFITSDNPFFVRPFFDTDNPLGQGLRTPRTITFVTLTPKVCLVLQYNEGKPHAGKRSLPGDMINDFNNQVALFSQRFIISHSNPLIKKVVERTKLDKQEPYKAIVDVESSPFSKGFRVIK